ncbi:amino acid/amide ABC transporter membrane protein 1, HAAT family [Ferrithrix thermotolerans DSM 19514]|uniref:Amino acid/amide ABC transporter membrane protein 1, HAAT family n=1 Tax=Ferrithrix thermotolerans DSM 19514 TaxID=1121881 RepID=A0A1M4S782_9ACTN|nr:amino acid/amide ABC transporter membrane protein 1, HAAT family [Ferrithrix thermotolerans DSM 19514]
MLFEYAVVAGVLFGLFYAFLSIGLNLVFGVQRIVNLAHGDVIMIGGFASWELYYTYHISPLLSVVLVIPPTVLAGFIIYRLIDGPLSRAQDPEMLSLILFFGVSQILEALVTIFLGNNQRSIPDSSLVHGPVHFLGQSYPGVWWIVAGASIPMVGLVILYLYRTKLGTATRAIMADPIEAAAVGIDVRKVSAITFGVGLAITASVGAIAPFMIGGVDPSEGVNLTILAFAVIVIGSLGNIGGTVVGGLIFGVAFELAQLYLPSWSSLIPYVLLLAVLLFKPSGVLGKRVRSA